MRRRTLIFAILGAGFLAAALIPLRPGELLPDSAGGLAIARDFFGVAFKPALTYEAGSYENPFLEKVLAATFATVRYGLAGVALALLLGAPLAAGCLPPRRGAGKLRRGVWHASRVTAAVLRSVHELFWAVLLLAAFGTVPALAVLALALPYAGTFAKLLPEIIVGSPERAENHLVATGAPPSLALLLGRLPGAVPDLTAYVLYRFECGLRSAAVMGFLGIPTLGYYLKLSFENLHYRECWTYLWSLGILVVAAEAWGSFMRARLVNPPVSPSGCISTSLRTALPADPLARLRALRPRDCLVRASFLVAAITATVSLLAPDLRTGELFQARRWGNAQRFLEETVPYALRDSDPSTTLSGWFAEYGLGTGLPAAWQTFLLAVVAIVLSASLAAVLVPPASATIASADPFSIFGGRVNRLANHIWAALRFGTRALCIILRAIPEYVWAFLLLAALGTGPWPLVLALVLHNAGILGRLGAELVENVPQRTPAVLASIGGTRATVLGVAVLPDIFPRALAYFFYRWETCVRESAVLGLLGLPSLGFAISEARVRTRYDEMLLYLLMSVVLVLVGDAVSHRLRNTGKLVS